MHCLMRAPSKVTAHALCELRPLLLMRISGPSSKMDAPMRILMHASPSSSALCNSRPLFFTPPPPPPPTSPLFALHRRNPGRLFAASSESPPPYPPTNSSKFVDRREREAPTTTTSTESVREDNTAAAANATSVKDVGFAKEETVRGGGRRKKALVKRAPPKRIHAAVDDAGFMREALAEARKAAKAGEVPVGAVLVHKNTIIARHHNRVETDGDPTAHAEMLCIRSAAAQLGGWRLMDVTLYVTLEPCPMCAGAILQARVGQLVWGARNSLLGADGSWIKLFPESAATCDECREAGASDAPPRSKKDFLHPFHRAIEVRRGVLADESSDVIQAFFQMRRLQTKGDDANPMTAGGGSTPWPRSPRWFPSVLKKLNILKRWFRF